MKVYHGTAAKSLASILRHGLRPRGKRKQSNWESYPSREDCVYLTEAYAPYFAWMATDSKTGERSLKSSERSLIVEVDLSVLDQSRLLPDEDFIAQAMASQLKVSIESVHEGIRNALEGYAHHAMDSLACLGNICHKGRIPAAAITRYVTIDFSKQQALWSACLDPTISLLNYRFCGDKYKSVIAWLFGDRDDFCVGHPGVDNEAYLAMVEKLQPGFAEQAKAMFANRQGIEVYVHNQEGSEG